MTTSFELYRNTRVLVTGLSGFKGQWLGKRLKKLGAEVVGLGLPPKADPHGCAQDLTTEFDCRHIDVRDSAAVEALVAAFRPQIIFHLAAQPLVRLSYVQPVETFATNIMGTVHVLEAARQTDSVRAVVNVTSDKCYENREWHWAYREFEPMGGHDPYSASKGCSELVTSAYRQAYASPQSPGDRHCLIATARAGNVIGGADWAEDRLIPDIVRAILADRPTVLRRPDAIRPWQHVLEALSGYLLLGARLLSGEERFATAWNFGPNDSDAVCVGEIARGVVQAWGAGEIIEEPLPTGPHEARYLKLDSSKAHAELQWKAILSTDERLQWTVDWYRHWHESPDRYWQLMDEQIDRYEARWQQWRNRKVSSSPASQDSLAARSRAA